VYAVGWRSPVHRSDECANVGEIRFFPDGSSTGGEITLAGGNAHRYVQVDWLTGRVAVYEDTAP
jgi:general secretion pathway protein H